MNDVKTWLVVNKEAEAQAHVLFKDLRINITTEGLPYLGALIGTLSFIDDFIFTKVEHSSSVLSVLSDLSSFSPHVAYAKLTHGIFNLWLFLSCTTANICHLLEPLGDLS